MAEAATIVIADDHPIVRQGLALLLDRQDDMRVIGEACDGEQTVKLARELKPDVILLDVKMPRMSCLEVLAEIARDPGDVRAIVLAGAAEDEQIAAPTRSGAVGFLL